MLVAAYESVRARVSQRPAPRVIVTILYDKFVFHIYGLQ
jgi:hypothetical protein